ncbi:hypothetical protein JCM8097_008304 [Rhodosporidiobolus ruineniae]
MAHNRVALITGAGRGIGLAATKLFLQNGYRVVASDIDLSPARKELAEGGAGKKVEFVEGDVTKEKDVEGMAQTALSKFGQLDASLINAGVLSPIVPWLDSPQDSVDKMLTVNVKGAWLTAKHSVRAMLDSPNKGRGSSMVFVSSVSSLYGEPGMSAYCASKWAVRGLSLTASQEFAPYGIRTNCIQPGATDTDMFNGFPDELREAIKKTVPLKRTASPLEIAQVMLFLSDPDKAGYMNGSSVAVHGGQAPT